MNVNAFLDELEKIGAAQQAAGFLQSAALPFLKKHWKDLGLLSAGGAAALGAKGEYEKYQLGRKVYEQMQGR